MHLMTAAYGPLVDRTANRGGILVFNSASYSISRIITGQLDAATVRFAHGPVHAGAGHATVYCASIED